MNIEELREAAELAERCKGLRAALEAHEEVKAKLAAENAGLRDAAKRQWDIVWTAKDGELRALLTSELGAYFNVHHPESEVHPLGAAYRAVMKFWRVADRCLYRQDNDDDMYFNATVPNADGEFFDAVRECRSALAAAEGKPHGAEGSAR